MTYITHKLYDGICDKGKNKYTSGSAQIVLLYHIMMSDFKKNFYLGYI